MQATNASYLLSPACTTQPFPIEISECFKTL